MGVEEGYAFILRPRLYQWICGRARSLSHFGLGAFAVKQIKCLVESDQIVLASLGSKFVRMSLVILASCCLFVFSVSDTDFLPFTRLRTTGSVVKKDLPPADDVTSVDIDIPFGLAFGNTSQTTAYVSAQNLVHLCQNSKVFSQLKFFRRP